ncbi:LOW QUALITY PROTEIN: osteocrin [Festucalex cinctus]
MGVTADTGRRLLPVATETQSKIMSTAKTTQLHSGKEVQEVMSHERLHIGKQTDRQTAAIKPDIKSAQGNRQEDTLKMHLCASLLFICLLSINAPECIAREPTIRQQHVDGDASVRAGPAAFAHPDGTKMLRPDRRAKAENDVTEPKRKTSLPGNGSLLDRLSVGAVNTKHRANGQRVIELPRRRLSLPPMDRIGMRRLPNRRG